MNIGPHLERASNLHNSSTTALVEKLTSVPAITGTLTALDAIQVQANPFNEVYSGQHCKLEVRSTNLGREVRLSIPSGVNMDTVTDEINDTCRNLYGRPAIQKKDLDRDGQIDTLAREGVVVTFIPILNDSNYRSQFGSDPATSHEGLLKDLNLHAVDILYIAAAVGAFRVAQGFPEENGMIGTEEDEGDLLQGFSTRAFNGELGTFHSGVGRQRFDKGRWPELYLAASSFPNSIIEPSAIGFVGPQSTPT